MTATNRPASPAPTPSRQHHSSLHVLDGGTKPPTYDALFHHRRLSINSQRSAFQSMSYSGLIVSQKCRLVID